MFFRLEKACTPDSFVHIINKSLSRFLFFFLFGCIWARCGCRSHGLPPTALKERDGSDERSKRLNGRPVRQRGGQLCQVPHSARPPPTPHLLVPLAGGVFSCGHHRFRPTYPPQVFELLRSEGARPTHLVADIGAGTGIFTQLLLREGFLTIAIEPNDSMRQGPSSLLPLSSWWPTLLLLLLLLLEQQPKPLLLMSWPADS